MRAFRLAGLLRVRTLLEEQAAARLAQANADRAAAQDQHARAVTALAQHTMPSQASAQRFALDVLGRDGLGQRVDDTATQVATAANIASQAQVEWADKRRESLMLEKLHNRHQVSVLEEQQRAEQALLDELASRKRGTDQEGRW